MVLQHSLVGKSLHWHVITIILFNAKVGIFPLILKIYVATLIYTFELTKIIFVLTSLKYIVPLFFLRCRKLYITLANGLTTSGKTNHGSNVQVEISSSLDYGTSYPQLIYLYLSRLTRLEYTILWTHFNLTLYMKTIPLIFVCPCSRCSNPL